MTTATAGAGTKGRRSAFFGVLQRIGRSLMLPIAVLPAAAILLRLGQPDLLGADGLGWVRVAEVVGKAGGALFDNLPLLFAVGVAIGFARKSDGSTALAAVVGYLVFSNVLTGFGDMVLVDPACTADDCAMERAAPNVGVLGGIVIGLTAAALYQRFYRIKLVPWLAFFGGRRFVPIITAVAALAWGVVFGLAWPPVGEALQSAAGWLYDNGPLGAGLFGVANRALIPLGMHHFLNSFLWFQAGECTSAAGKALNGDLTCFFSAQDRDPDVGIFMTGFFPIMMFALPAAALAMVHEARDSKRKATAGILVSAALTSFVTGVTEPIEFAFLFVAPLLFAAHALLTGVSMALTAALGIRDGFGFSAGLIDYLLNYNIAERPLLLLPIGLVYAAVYYVVFRFLIRRFDLMTPGREPDDDSDETAASVPADRAGGATVTSDRT